MSISMTQYAQALSQQKLLADRERLKRCDELAEQQPVLFFELLTFARDGVPADISRNLIDYLSVLQSLSTTVSESAAQPASMSEFQGAIKRTALRTKSQRRGSDFNSLPQKNERPADLEPLSDHPAMFDSAMETWHKL